MIIKSATGLAFAAACLTSIATLPAAQAQMADPYGTAPGAYGAAPGNPGYGPPASGYGRTSGNYTPQNQYMPPPATGTGGTEVVTNAPQTDVGDVSPNWSARQNVRESERYDRLLETNRGFRMARVRKECGPITDPQLHQQCLDSFAQYEPRGSATGYGTSTAPRRYQSNYGR